MKQAMKGMATPILGGMVIVIVGAGCDRLPFVSAITGSEAAVEECCETIVDPETGEMTIIVDDCCAEPDATTEAVDDCCEDTLEEASAAPAGGVAIPPGVRDNLGINFATVERRAVGRTRRVPGQFEIVPTARQEYRAVPGGRIELRVAQFEAVDAGQVLFTIDSPRWRQIQHEAVEAEGDITMMEAALEVARARRGEARASLAKQDERLKNLASVKVRKAELEAEAAMLRNSLPRLDAEIRAQEAALREAHEHYTSRLKGLSSVTGLPVDALRAENGDESTWRSIAALEVRAQRAGVVEVLAVNNGGWLEEGELALTLLDTRQIRFHAEAPQSDIALFRAGQRARIVPPQGGSVALQNTMEGVLTLGLTAHTFDRTVSLYVTPDSLADWAKAGVAGYLEVVLVEAADDSLAIPTAAIIQDGLDTVFYRRNPANPDRALRVVADLGESDGRWTVVRSGVKEGDEVVLDGAYALKLSGGEQQAPEGYHYHADGSLHADH